MSNTSDTFVNSFYDINIFKMENKIYCVYKLKPAVIYIMGNIYGL